MENYSFFTVNNRPVINDRNEVCLEKINDGTLEFVIINDELRQVMESTFPTTSSKAFTKPVTDAEGAGSSGSETEMARQARDCSGEMTEVRGGSVWSRPATLELINMRKDFESYFKSTTMKNDKVWDLVAKEMKKKNFIFTYTQCRDRWQYLKKKYVKKVDNMGDRGTGEDKMRFDYFEEMDELLGKKSNIKPPTLASSLRGNIPSSDQGAEEVLAPEEDSAETIPVKKYKKENRIVQKKEDPITKFINQVHESTERREAARERRHQETLQSRDRAIDTFAQKMDSMIAHLKKNK